MLKTKIIKVAKGKTAEWAAPEICTPPQQLHGEHLSEITILELDLDGKLQLIQSMSAFSTVAASPPPPPAVVFLEQLAHSSWELEWAKRTLSSKRLCFWPQRSRQRGRSHLPTLPQAPLLWLWWLSGDFKSQHVFSSSPPNPFIFHFFLFQEPDFS